MLDAYLTGNPEAAGVVAKAVVDGVIDASPAAIVAV